MKFLIFGVSVLGGLLLGSAAMAAESDTGLTRGNDRRIPPEYGMHNAVSILGNVGFGYSGGTGIGISGRYQYVVVPNGFLTRTSIFDEFGIEAAVDYNHYSFGLYGFDDISYNELGVSASAVWNVWFSDQFAVYPRVGLGYAFGSWEDDIYDDYSDYGGFFLVGGDGILYELGVVKLRAELNNTTLSGGIAITL